MVNNYFKFSKIYFFSPYYAKVKSQDHKHADCPVLHACTHYNKKKEKGESNGECPFKKGKGASTDEKGECPFMANQKKNKVDEAVNHDEL